MNDTLIFGLSFLFLVLVYGFIFIYNNEKNPEININLPEITEDSGVVDYITYPFSFAKEILKIAVLPFSFVNSNIHNANIFIFFLLNTILISVYSIFGYSVFRLIRG